MKGTITKSHGHTKFCETCAHFGVHKTAYGTTIGYRCNGDPSGRKWAPEVAMKDARRSGSQRCGSQMRWFKSAY